MVIKLRPCIWKKFQTKLIFFQLCTKKVLKNSPPLFFDNLPPKKKYTRNWINNSLVVAWKTMIDKQICLKIFSVNIWKIKSILFKFFSKKCSVLILQPLLTLNCNFCRIAGRISREKHYNRVFLNILHKKALKINVSTNFCFKTNFLKYWFNWKCTNAFSSILSHHLVYNIFSFWYF